jgi:hypothetical protein
MSDLDTLVAAITAMTPGEQSLLDALMQIDTSVPLDDPRVDRCPLGFLRHCVSVGLLQTWVITGTLVFPTCIHTEHRLSPTLDGWAAWQRFIRATDEGRFVLPRWLVTDTDGGANPCP